MQNNRDLDASRLISKRELLRLVPLSYSTIWNMMRRGEFPLSVRLGSRANGARNTGKAGWKIREVEAWMSALPRSEYRAPSTPDKKNPGAEQ